MTKYPYVKVHGLYENGFLVIFPFTTQTINRASKQVNGKRY